MLDPSRYMYLDTFDVQHLVSVFKILVQILLWLCIYLYQYLRYLEKVSYTALFFYN